MNLNKLNKQYRHWGLDLDLQPQNFILFYQTYGSIFDYWWSII